MGDPNISFQVMLDAAPDAIIGADRDGKIVMANAQTRLVFGYERGELIGQPVELLVPVDLDELHRHHREKYGEDPHLRPMGAVEFSGRRSDGSFFPAEISLSSIDTPQGPIALAAIRDITERREFQANLQAAREEADRANQAKSQFLSRMSHELRTPLNAILGFAQLLEIDDDFRSRRQREAVEQILLGGRLLLELINEVLDISRIESSTINLAVEPVLLDELIARSVDLMAPLAVERDVQVSLDPIKDGIWVRADRQRLTQVLLNLLSNAIKYNRVQGNVHVSVQATDDAQATILVADTGPGIEASLQSRLFEPFERLGAERTAIEGSGLGLALARRLVFAMGGILDFVTSPDNGSTFSVTLPTTEASSEHTTATTQNVQALLPEPTRPVKILHVEDNLANLRLLESVFAVRDNYELVSAMQGRLALHLAHSTKPALILLDLHLPDIPGAEVLDALRADPETAKIPVIVITADAEPLIQQEIVAKGVSAFLTKPLDLRQFIAAVAQALPGGQPV